MCLVINRWYSSAALYRTSVTSPKCLLNSNKNSTGCPDLKHPRVSSGTTLFTATSFMDDKNLKVSWISSLLRLFLLSLKMGSGGEPNTEREDLDPSELSMMSKRFEAPTRYTRSYGETGAYFVRMRKTVWSLAPTILRMCRVRRPQGLFLLR